MTPGGFVASAIARCFRHNVGHQTHILRTGVHHAHLGSLADQHFRIRFHRAGSRANRGGGRRASGQPAPRREGEGQGEIIVTATKRASTVQDVPFSINAQTQADIERAHAKTLEDIARNVAGLTVQNLGPGQSQVSVRGVSAGQIARDQPGVKEQVGVYLDETVTSLSLFTPDFDLYDLNRVETLRGPQGTLFGSGSVGGTLRYITNQPKLDRTRVGARATSTYSRTAASATASKARSTFRSATRPRCASSAMARTSAASSIRSGRTTRTTSTTEAAIGGRASLLWQPTPGAQDHAAHRLPKGGGRRIQSRRPLHHLRQSVHHAGRPRQARAISAVP